jgi:hypothetical protein
MFLYICYLVVVLLKIKLHVCFKVLRLDPYFYLQAPLKVV